VHWEGAAWPVPKYYNGICLHTKCETGQQKLAEIQTRYLPCKSLEHYQQINKLVDRSLKPHLRSLHVTLFSHSESEAVLSEQVEMVLILKDDDGGGCGCYDQTTNRQQYSLLV
jgi:hypothetical protein